MAFPLDDEHWIGLQSISAMHKDLSWSWLCSAQDALLCDRTLALELETIEMFDFKLFLVGTKCFHWGYELSVYG